ncbi:MAG: DUF2232 domain-containing protein [Gemmatimonadaceae bacterium]|nr:DUF2232 domain-containing protein [Gemmatimonadaceae bacterium]
MADTAAPAPVRGSWRRLAIGLFAFILAWQVPHLRAILPIEQTAMLLVPIVAVCAVLAWRQGGRVWIAVAGIALSALLLSQSVGPPDSPYGWLARGWTMLLAASFGLVCLFAPAEAFFPRALSALAVAMALGFALLLVTPGGAVRVGNMVASELNRRNDESLARNRDARNQPSVKEAFESSPRLRWLSEETERQIAGIPKWSSVLVPALLAIESLIAMALAWSLFQRVSPVQIGPPLGSFREFRFNDQLVWGVAVGASIYLLPAFSEGRNAGLNILVFFGALYALRGAGIMTWMTRGRTMTAIVVLMILIAPPLVAALAFGLGLGDTWLDWRTRMPARQA